MKRFLFIGHDATRTGAPMVLLHFLRWLRATESNIEIDLLLMDGGPLEDAYREVADVYLLSPPRTVIRRIRDRLSGSKRSSFDGLDLLDLLPFKNDYDAVVGNTVVSLELLNHLKTRGRSTICWIHEMKYVIDLYFSRERFLELTGKVDRVVATSWAVRAALTEGFGVETQVDVVYEFVPPTPEVVSITPGRMSMGIPKDGFVVLGCGFIGRRKGVDLFVEIAQRLTQKRADIFFVWVGGKPKGKDDYADRIRSLQKQSGLGERLIFTGELESPQRLFSEMDVFALTSLEDPFPLVCLMAADVSKPIVCFEGAGGMPEFVEDDAGVVVPHSNVEAFSLAIEHYFDDRQELRRAGNAAKEKLRTKFSMELSCKRLLEIIENGPN